jgi:hypothetical protein
VVRRRASHTRRNTEIGLFAKSSSSILRMGKPGVPAMSPKPATQGERGSELLFDSRNSISDFDPGARRIRQGITEPEDALPRIYTV